jgi:FkbM family methyltransferase
VKLRNGISIYAPNDIPLLNLIDDIWRINVYTPLDFQILPDDLVVDIGANVGVFSTYAAKQTKNKVYAFEPYPDNFETLVKNISRNNLNNIQPQSYAISAYSGIVKLYVAKNKAGNLLFNRNIEGKMDEHIEVKSLTLQKAMDLNHIKHIDFLKMDCEGAEFGIIMNTPKDYIRKVNKISMEFHNNVNDHSHDFLVQILKDCDFKVDLSWNGTSPFGYIYALKR